MKAALTLHLQNEKFVYREVMKILDTFTNDRCYFFMLFLLSEAVCLMSYDALLVKKKFFLVLGYFFI